MHRPTSRPRLRIRAGGNRKGIPIDANLREADRRSDRMRGAPSVACSRTNVNRRTHSRERVHSSIRGSTASSPLSAPWPDFRSSEHGVGAKPSHERRGTSVARGQMPDNGCGRLSGAPGCPLREWRLSARVRRENETSFPVHSKPLDQSLHLPCKQIRSG